MNCYDFTFDDTGIGRRYHGVQVREENVDGSFWRRIDFYVVGVCSGGWALCDYVIRVTSWLLTSLQQKVVFEENETV